MNFRLRDSNDFWQITALGQRIAEQSKGTDYLSAVHQDLIHCLKNAGLRAISAVIEGHVLALVRRTEISKEAKLEDNIHKMLQDNPDLISIHRSHLSSAEDIRLTFHAARDYYRDLVTAFPEQRQFDYFPLQLIGECKEDILAMGQEYSGNKIAFLDPLDQSEKGSSADLTRTLSVYLLDCGMNMEKTAQLLHLHVNSVKYRLHRIHEILGYDPCILPQLTFTYRALVLRRISRKSCDRK